MRSAEPLLYETHSHTPLCKHAIGEPQDYAQVAFDRGLRGHTVTCHNPMPNGYNSEVRMAADEFETYLDGVRRAQLAWEGRVDVRLGLECDYFPGYESWLEQQVMSANFDYVLGSVHPQCEEFHAKFWDGDPFHYQQAYFEQLAAAAETGFFDCLSHPDLVKNQVSESWSPDQILDDIRRALDRIAATGIAMELNTSGANKKIREMNPFPEMLREMHARGIPVVVGADAHTPTRVGDRFDKALALLADCGFDRVNYFIGRVRQEVMIDEARASLVVAGV
jgi:histidinol-phosphatase (PHP family)